MGRGRYRWLLRLGIVLVVALGFLVWANREGLPNLLTIENRSGQPQEMELLYHTNLGPPFLGAGSRVLAPLRVVVPFNARAVEGIDTYDAYLGPTAGYTEQNYLYELLGDARGHTLALLVSANRDRAVARLDEFVGPKR